MTCSSDHHALPALHTTSILLSDDDDAPTPLQRLSSGLLPTRARTRTKSCNCSRLANVAVRSRNVTAPLPSYVDQSPESPRLRARTVYLQNQRHQRARFPSSLPRTRAWRAGQRWILARSRLNWKTSHRWARIFFIETTSPLVPFESYGALLTRRAVRRRVRPARTSYSSTCVNALAASTRTDAHYPLRV
ncbi:hypothetical protein EXIGLDRAFT_724512 [Exidia glandulosa HHB12029]|uniref:Uncharacterized protein n=1 Tax=Exidia glandulosa HHB12029 TaxID=1314781 RepID=A0A165EDJ4_EXIGL|nr:hypothetical protein EXIGLDRAFT_724512 [Exidia glandulosa HHB12029]